MNALQAYQILGLEQGASLEEIKVAYRRQVKKRHPDVNKAPGAHEQFVLLRQAYEYLLKYNSLAVLAPTYEEDAEEKARREQWQREKRARWEKRQEEEALQRFLVLQKVYLVMNYLVACCLAYGSFLALDYALPPEKQQEKVVEVYKIYESAGHRGGGSKRYSYDDVHFRNFKIRVPKGEGPAANSKALVYTSPLLRLVRRAEIGPKGKTQILQPAYGFYNTFGFLIPLLLFLGVTYYRLPLRGEGRLTAGVIVLFIGFFHFVLALNM